MSERVETRKFCQHLAVTFSDPLREPDAILGDAVFARTVRADPKRIAERRARAASRPPADVFAGLFGSDVADPDADFRALFGWHAVRVPRNLRGATLSARRGDERMRGRQENRHCLVGGDDLRADECAIDQHQKLRSQRIRSTDA